jgi:hypothetical protein
VASADRTRPDWTFLLRPRWLCWHGFAVVAAAGMLWLGGWQLHRAESGNELSWAYTFEWPLFAILGVLFWAKSLREEIRLRSDAPDCARQEAAAGDRAGPPGPVGEAPEAYLARLQAEARGRGTWHGWR